MLSKQNGLPSQLVVHTMCFVSLAVANAKAAGKAMLLHTYLLSTAAIKLQLGAYAVDTERAMKERPWA